MRYFVQAYRKAHWESWPTHWSGEDAAEAVGRAQKLHDETGRPVRVVDDEERKIWKSKEPANQWAKRTSC